MSPRIDYPCYIAALDVSWGYPLNPAERQAYPRNEFVPLNPMSSAGENHPMEPMERLLRELRARRLDRVAVGYAVAGWLLVQAASIALPSFDAAPWVLRAVIIFTLLGFPLALAIAWFAAPHIFEVHSHHAHLKPTHAVLFFLAAVVVFVAAALSYL